MTQSFIHVGEQVYAGSDQIHQDAQEVCRSIPALKRWLSRIPKDSRNGCTTIKHGTSVIIESIAKPEGSEDVFVRLRSARRTFEGYSLLAYVEPPMPPGAVLEMSGDWSSSLLLASGPASGRGVDIGYSATVQVISFHPSNLNSTLFVRVLDGPFKGRLGWMSVQQSTLMQPGGGLYGVVVESF